MLAIRHIAAPLTLMALVLPASACAGEQLGLQHLVQHSVAIVEVELDLGQRGASPRLLRRLSGDRAGLEKALSQGSALQPCLPDTPLLQRWLRQGSGTHQSRQLWRHALQRGRYRSVLFLVAEGSGLRALCETEVLSAEAWPDHPEHTRWRRSLETWIQTLFPSAAVSPATEAELPTGAASEGALAHPTSDHEVPHA